jgi:hypothetical protein
MKVSSCLFALKRQSIPALTENHQFSGVSSGLFRVSLYNKPDRPCLIPVATNSSRTEPHLWQREILLRLPHNRADSVVQTEQASTHLTVNITTFRTFTLLLVSQAHFHEPRHT